MTARRSISRAVTAQESALIGLRELIRAGELAPGQRIDQRRAAEQLECSIVPVREALKTLEAEGQVAYSPQRGYFVAAMDAQELRELYRIRELLEDEAIRTAIPHVDSALLRVLGILLDEYDEAASDGSVPELIAADRRLHLTLYAACGMTRLVGLLRMLWDSTDRYRAQIYADRAHAHAMGAEHRAIIAAVERRDVATTVRLLAAHREHSIIRVQTIMDGQPDPRSRAPRLGADERVRIV
jgi:DNA-binding GntR family transcriptional regulator